jgi:hypothetical protein
MIILSVQGQANVAAIRFSPASPPNLGECRRESEAFQTFADFCSLSEGAGDTMNDHTKNVIVEIVGWPH